MCIGLLKQPDTKKVINRHALLKLFKTKNNLGRNKYYFPWPDYGTRR